MKRIISLLLLSVVFVTLFASCTANSPDSSSDFVSSESSYTDESENSSVIDFSDTSADTDVTSDISDASSNQSDAEPDEVYNVVFIGNSLTLAENMPHDLKQISAGKYNVADLSVNGATLNDHIENIDDPRRYYKKPLESADIVVLQEYGGGMTDDATLKALMDKIRQISGDDVRFYYMIPHVAYAYTYPEFDTGELVAQQLSGYEGITVLPLGVICQYIMENRFDSDISAFLPDGLHPSSLNAAFAAMAFQIIIDDAREPLVNWTEKMPKSVLMAIPGESNEEKQSLVVDIQQNAYDFYRSVADKYSVPVE